MQYTQARGTIASQRASSALGRLRDICDNCPGLPRLALPCGGTPAAIPYIHLDRLRIHRGVRIHRGDGKDLFFI